MANSAAIIEALRPYAEAPPADLVAHFLNAVFPADPELEIDILPLERALPLTDLLQKSSVLASTLGLVALDDANNSNHYCYATKEPVRGSIVYLCHDEWPWMAFQSLRDFLDAINAAIANRTWNEDIVPDKMLPQLNRDAITTAVERLVDDDEATEVICFLLSLLRTSDPRLMSELARHGDFYVRVAVADHIAEYPNADAQPTCKQLASDKHPWVAERGQLALAAVIGPTQRD